MTMRYLLPVLAIVCVAVSPAVGGEQPLIDPKLLEILEKGADLLQAGKLDDAGNVFIDALKQFPSDERPVVAILQTGRRLVDQKETGAALKLLDRAIELSTKKAELNLAAATILIESKNNSDALARVRKAAEQDPKNVRVLSSALTCLAAMEKFDAESRQLAEQLHALQPRPIDAFLFLGLWHEKNNEFAAAADYYLNAVTLDTNYMQSRLMLGKLYEKTEKLDLAEREYIKMTKIAPEHFSGYLCLSELYLKQGQKDLADEFAKEAARLKEAAQRPPQAAGPAAPAAQPPATQPPAAQPAAPAVDKGAAQPPAKQPELKQDKPAPKPEAAPKQPDN